MTAIFLHPETGCAYTFTPEMASCDMCKHWEVISTGSGWCNLFKELSRADGECMANWEPWAGAFDYADRVEEVSK